MGIIWKTMSSLNIKTVGILFREPVQIMRCMVIFPSMLSEGEFSIPEHVLFKVVELMCKRIK